MLPMHLQRDFICFVENIVKNIPSIRPQNHCALLWSWASIGDEGSFLNEDIHIGNLDVYIITIHELNAISRLKDGVLRFCGRTLLYIKHERISDQIFSLDMKW